MIRPLAAALTAALVLAAPAHATPQFTPDDICTRVELVPTIGGVLGAALDLADAQDLTDTQAGRVVARVILDDCPQFSALLQRIVERYEGQIA